MNRIVPALAVALVAVAAMLGTAALSAANGGDVFFSILTLLSFLPYVTTGFLIAWRRPEIPIGWLVLALPVLFGVGVLFGEYSLFAARTGALLGPVALWLALWFWVPGWLALGLVFLLFPDGRLPSECWRRVAWGIVSATVLAVVAWGFNNDPRGTQTGQPNPLAVDLPFSLYDVGIALLFVIFAVPAASLIARYRRADGRVRRQIKWLGYGSFALVLLSFGYLVLLRSTEAVSVGAKAADVLFLAGIAAPAVAIGIAILRDRVFDIDILIHRTLVYGVVSAVLVGTYAAAVVLLQTLLRPFTAGSDLAVAASTLLVVALFQPVRRRLQDFVDRRFYRSRYDASRAVDAFASRLRSEVDIESVRTDLVGVVHDTLRPAHAALWLRERQP